jgi:hypothetical protein
MAQSENLNNPKASDSYGAAGSCDFMVNDAGTSKKSGTELTQRRSRDVRAGSGA